MRTYLARRLLLSLVTLCLTSIGIFALLRLSPGDPATLQQGQTATPERIAAIRQELRLDRALPEQYVLWLGDIARGDLGRSYLSQTSLVQEFETRFPVTLQLMVMTLGWVGLFGVGLGALAALRNRSAADNGLRLAAVLGQSLPAFWVASLVLLVPAQLWGYAPPLGQTPGVLSQPLANLQLFLPASLVLAAGPVALVMRLTRASLIEVLREDYVRTARSKGLGQLTLVIRHVLPNAFLPILTVFGLLTVELLGGSLVIENVFALHGLGSYTFQAFLQKDYAVAQTLILYTCLVVIAVNLVVDVLYAAVDPRTRMAQP